MKKTMCVSGGINSVAMMYIIWKHNEVYEVDRILFADTGLEYPEMYEYLDTLRDKGYPIETVKTLQRFDDWFYGKVTRGKHEGKMRGFPSVIAPCWWMREAKQKVLSKECKNSIAFIGYTANEEKRVNQKHNYGYKTFFPLYEWGFTQEMCIKSLRYNDLWNPLYNHVDRTGCWLCPKQSKKSLMFLRLHHSELWERLKDYENADSKGFNTNKGALEKIDTEYDSIKFQSKLTEVINKSVVKGSVWNGL